MPNPPRIHDLLLRWEEAKAEGHPLSVEELCADYPDLVEPLRYRIAKLEAVDHLLDGPRGLTTQSTMERPGPVGFAITEEVAWNPPGFEILGELGRGGMGVVYMARQINLDRIVALKTIPASALAGPRAIARFDIEARAVARLQHPQIVQIHEVGSHAGCPFIALEYMEGGSLSHRLEEKPFDFRLAAQIAEGLARATQYAHTRGIIHRDLKPSNVLLGTADGVLDAGSLKISDFGLAKLLGEGNSSHLTQSGTTLGTPSYMAPEQAQGRVEAIGPRTDVYGLGAILYEMLCGRPPFQAHSDWLTIHQVVSSPPPPVRATRPECPPALEAICLRCLSKDPSGRYESAEALADDLNRFLEGVPVTTPMGVPLTRRAWMAGTALSVFAAVGATTFHVVRRPHPIGVGIIQSQTEFMNESGRAVINATLFAIEEVNRQGGVLGHPLWPIVADGRSDETVFASEARRLIGEEGVRVLFACLTSTHRRAVEPVVEAFNSLLVYPGESEGLEQSRHVVCLGPLPNQHLIPAMNWCRDALGKRRFFLVGSDSVYSHAVRAILGDAAPEMDVEIVGESYGTNADVVDWVVKAVEKIEDKPPDAILNLIAGQANLTFIHHLRSRKITPARIPTLSFCFAEQNLRSILREMVGDYLCGHYFQSLRTPENSRFLARLAEDPMIGGNPIVSDSMVAAYMGVRLWAKAVARAGTFDYLAALRQALTTLDLPGPGGPVKVDPDVLCDSKYARVARVDEDRKIVMVWSSRDPIIPVAYPATRSRARWDELIRQLHAGWGNRWSFHDPANDEI